MGEDYMMTDDKPGREIAVKTEVPDWVKDVLITAAVIALEENPLDYYLIITD